VRLPAADSQLNAKMRTFRTAEANVLASLVEHTATVVGDLDVRSRGAIADRAASPGIGAAAATSSTATAMARVRSRHDGARSVARAPSAASLDPSDLGPLLGDVAAFNLDAIGLPFSLISTLAATGDIAISDISQGLFIDLLPDVINTVNFDAGHRLSSSPTISA
jgi:hypothetical protein